MRPGARRLRWVLVAVGVLAVALVVMVVVSVLTRPAVRGGIGDTKPGGHAAVAALLRDEGLTVSETSRFADLRDRVGPDTTVVVGRTAMLRAESWQGLLDLAPGRIVLIGPGRDLLLRLGLPVTAVDPVSPDVAEPVCADPAARRAGAISAVGGGVAYTAPNARVRCYPYGTGHLYVQTVIDGVEVVVMPAVASNRRLADRGNASLAMQAIGSRPTVVWYHPGWSDPTIPGLEAPDRPDNDLPFPSLLPRGWLTAVGLACVAVLVLAVWRGRRLGPVLTEQLPSVVPAAETVEGHGRLYERIGARDTAAHHLRAATRARLSRLLGRADDPELLAQVLADRTGWPYHDIRQLLDGPAPPSDDALVTLKRQLDALEQEVRRP